MDSDVPKVRTFEIRKTKNSQNLIFEKATIRQFEIRMSVNSLLQKLENQQFEYRQF